MCSLNIHFIFNQLHEMCTALRKHKCLFVESQAYLFKQRLRMITRGFLYYICLTLNIMITVTYSEVTFHCVGSVYNSSALY